MYTCKYFSVLYAVLKEETFNLELHENINPYAYRDFYSCHLNYETGL